MDSLVDNWATVIAQLTEYQFGNRLFGALRLSIHFSVTEQNLNLFNIKTIKIYLLNE